MCVVVTAVGIGGTEKCPYLFWNLIPGGTPSNCYLIKNPESHTSVASLSAQKIVISKYKALVLFSIHDSEQTLFTYWAGNYLLTVYQLKEDISCIESS